MTRIVTLDRHNNLTETATDADVAAVLASTGYEVLRQIAEEDTFRMTGAQLLRRQAELIAALRTSDVR